MYNIGTDKQDNYNIYDIDGRNVDTIMNGDLTSGYHSFIWIAENQSSGIYFFIIMANEEVKTQKLTLIK